MAEERHYNTTVMFIDMAGYTSKSSKLSRAELQDTLEEFEKTVTPVVKNFGGKIIKGMGDAYLITFHSPTNSVLCAVEIQKRIKERNQGLGEKETFEARIGISSGEVYERGGDIFGTPVNLASRIQTKAMPGEILFGESVYHAMNKNEIKYSSLGKQSLKGIDDKIEIYSVESSVKFRGFFTKIKNFLKRRKWWIIGLFILLIIISSSNNQKLEENWIPEANAALEKNDIKTMESLMKIYEEKPDDWKNFEKRMLALRMYLSMGKRDRAINEFTKLWEISDPGQKEELKRIANERGIDISRFVNVEGIQKEPIMMEQKI
jgi:class 3 adenylate cyclase